MLLLVAVLMLVVPGTIAEIHGTKKGYFPPYSDHERDLHIQDGVKDTIAKKSAIIRRGTLYIENLGGIFSAVSNNNSGKQVGISYHSSLPTDEGGAVVVRQEDDAHDPGKKSVIVGLSVANGYSSANSGGNTGSIIPVIRNYGGIFTSKEHVNTGEQVEIGIAVQPARRPVNGNFGYYWQEYNGIIPSDALPAGKTAYGADTYIAQAPIHQNGIFIGEIFSGKKSVEFQSYGITVLESGIKILSTQQKQKFRWLPTRATTFDADTTNKYTVIGGQNLVEPKQLNICRVRYGGAVRVGAVAPVRGRNTYCYFAANGKQQVIDEYEVLVYEE